jgi:hypothetical protein
MRLLAPPPPCFESFDDLDGPDIASRSFGEMGTKENGSKRFPRSASGDPSVHSSQSSIPITLGSVG